MVLLADKLPFPNPRLKANSYIQNPLWVELCPLKIHTLKS